MTCRSESSALWVLGPIAALGGWTPLAAAADDDESAGLGDQGPEWQQGVAMPTLAVSMPMVAFVEGLGFRTMSSSWEQHSADVYLGKGHVPNTTAGQTARCVPWQCP